MKLVCLLFLYFLSSVASRPNPPKEFDAVITIFTHWGSPQIFHGQMMWDVPRLRASIFIKQSGNYQLHIARWDQNKTYTIINNQCYVAGADRKQADPWSWLTNAIYRGSYSFGEKICDLWISDDASISGCFLRPNDTPLFYNLTRALDYVFEQFNGRPQNPSEFEPPKTCFQTRIFTVPSVQWLFSPVFLFRPH
jgi:hypothetical protein